jgi:hypothetical protein
LVRAQARGAIDWRDHDPRNPFDVLRARALLQALRRDEDVENARDQAWVALAQYLKARDDTSSGATSPGEQANQALARLHGLRYPWAAADIERQRGREVDKLKDIWESKWGSLDDPRTAKLIDEVAQAMLAGPRTSGYTGTIFNARTASELPLREDWTPPPPGWIKA